MEKIISLSEVTQRKPIKVDTEIQPSMVNLPREEVASTTPFNLHIELYKKPIGYDVYGRIEGRIELICSRCNRKFEERMEKSFYYQLMPTSEMSDGEIKSGGLDVKFSDSNILDLAEVVEEQILLNLPQKPLCSEECKVPYSALEEEQKFDKRLKKLKALRDKLKEKEK